MKKIALLVCLCIMVCIGNLDAQLLLIDDMEGNGPASGNWIYNAGANATGSVIFNAANPSPSSLNPSSHAAKFTKDTSCSPYMAAAVTLSSPLDLSAGATFKMMVYSSVKEDVMFKLQPGTDYTQAVFQTYRIQNVNQWEEAVFTFTGINHRTDLNRIAIQFIDGKKANGILYFDHIQAPNPTSLQFTPTNIPMGSENGKIIEVKLHGDVFKPALSLANWTASTLPPGVSVGSLLRVNDTTAHIILSGNSSANYSRTSFTLTVNGDELQNPNVTSYAVKGSVVFDGNPNWTMIYNDEFDINGLPDPSKWTIDARPKGWINNEQQVYTDASRDNARVRNGNLVITGKKDFPTGDPNAPWSSARVVSLGKMEFLYGKVEMKAKLPRARGSWPAFWLMPVSSAYGNWPRSGEVDILEHVGNNFGKAMCAVHTENKNWTNGGNLGGNQIMPDVDTVYHVYGVEWSPDSLRFTHDGVGFYTYVNPKTDWKDWPFDKPFFVILNIAIGGGMGGAITDADWPDSMQVDYVRIYQKGLGTPVLDSITITPADVSVLPGKTQQFTAKVLDQNGHTMNGITPSWSITGAGNTINSAGLATIQSSGVVTASATHDTISLSGSTSINVRATNYKTIPARIEAEAFDNSNVCCTENTADTSGVLNVSYIGNGTWFEYDINVPDSAAYRIRFRVAANSSSGLQIKSDTTLLSTVQLPPTGGWQTWKTIISAPIVFGPGQQTIRIVSSSSGWNFNWLQFVPAADHQVNSMSVQPDSARILLGETLQLKAIGRDQDSNFIMIFPEPAWTVSGSGAHVSTEGIFSSDSVGVYKVTATSGALSDSSSVSVLGSPVLTTILIKPDTLIIPVGASQQFTAKGFDQYGAQVPLIDSVYWTVTGTGNTINNNGLLVAGNTPGTYTVNATSAGITGTLALQLGYTCTVNNRYEAESASSKAAGLTPVTTDDINGGQHFENVTSGKWFAYSALKVPSAGRYTIRLRVSTTAAARIRIGHGSITYRLIDIPSTGGQWQTISDTLTLPALNYTGIHGVSGSFKFNWFAIDNCATAPTPLANIKVAPDTILLATGSQYLFKATGYDSSNYIVNLPSLQWSVNGTGNTIDSTGLLSAGTTPGAYTIIANSDSITGTAMVRLVECSVNTKYEAESFSARHSGPVLESCTDLGGGQNFTGLAPGHYFAYNTLNVPSAGLYRISFRVLSTAPSQVRVGHGSFTFGIITIPSTNGEWRTITDTITLPALSYTGIHVVSGSFKFNYFNIDNCSANELAQLITIQPIPDKRVGDEGFKVNASASSGLPVIYTSADTSIASINESGEVQMHKAGVVAITVTQPGNKWYSEAQLSRSFSILPLNLQLQYFNANTTVSGNSLRPYFRILNLDSVGVDYRELTARYWFTSENFKGINTWIDYAELGNKIRAKYTAVSAPRNNAFGYLEFSFDSSTGILQPGTNSGAIQSRASGTNWALFNEENDYSRANTSTYVSNERITLYRNGKLIWGIEPEEVAEIQEVSISSQIRSAGANTISAVLKLFNLGNVPLNYEDVRIRYWFTSEGNASLNYWIDYADAGSTNIQGEFVRPGQSLPGADAYLEFKFKPGLGTFYPLSDCGNIQFRIAKSDWSVFDQSNDHSYSGAAVLTPNPHITVYYKNILIAGIEPVAGLVARKMSGTHETTTNQPSGKTVIYPNPVKDILHIQLSQVSSGANLRIINTAGAVVYLSAITSTKQTLSLKSLPAGLYQLVIINGKEIVNEKLLKE